MKMGFWKGWGKPFSTGIGTTGGSSESILPYLFETAALGDGALPAPWTGSTYAIASAVAVNTPTEGSELLTDGGLEAWASSTNLTDYTEDLVGTSTVTQETTEIHGGSNAAKILVDGSGSKAVINQVPSLTLGDWINSSMWAKSPSSSAVFLRAENALNSQVSVALTTSYAQYRGSHVYRVAAGWKIAAGSLAGNANDTQYIDDLSLKKITTTTLYATLNALQTDVTVKGQWTITPGTLAGVIANLDSISSPQNCVVLVHNGSVGNLYLWKCVAGAWSQVATGAATYVANANVELRKTAATTYQMWYNGAQIGADQTISDAGIINNTIHGMITTYGGNSLNRFFCGVGPEIISVPNGATISSYIPQVSPGDILRLAAGGSYTLAGGATGFSTLKSGTAANHITVDGNGATITGGAVGISLTNKVFIDVQNLTLVDQTSVAIAPSGSDDISFTNVSVSNSTGVLLDMWKIRNCDRVTITGGTSTLLVPSTTLTCDGVEFWGPCNDCTVTGHTAVGFNNGSGDDHGHAFEVYGESGAEICDSIHFVNCVATNSRAGFSIEGGPSANALHTDCLCNTCSGTGNIVADFRGAEGATLYKTNSPGTTQGSVVEV